MISRKISARSKNIFAYTLIFLILLHRLAFPIPQKQLILTQKRTLYKKFAEEFTIYYPIHLRLTDTWKGGKLSQNQMDGSALNMLKQITHNESETESFGKELAKWIPVPSVLCLYGELGAGKTAFVRGLAEGFGITSAVSSPTFTIVNEYPGNPDLIHFDMYRLHDADELFDIGWEDYLRRDSVLAVEWSENVEEAFDGSEIIVRFTKLSDTDRLITMEGELKC